MRFTIPPDDPLGVSELDIAEGVVPRAPMPPSEDAPQEEHDDGEAK